MLMVALHPGRLYTLAGIAAALFCTPGSLVRYACYSSDVPYRQCR